MALSSRGPVTSILAAAVLLMQTIVSVPGACACSSEQLPVVQSCCHQEPEASAEETATSSCCGSDQCGCESTASVCLGNCHCGDQDAGAPAAPTNAPKPNPRDVELSFHVPHPAVHSAILSPQREVSRAPPRDMSTADSVQALLCIWRI